MTWRKIADSFSRNPMNANNTILPAFQVISDTKNGGLIVVITTFFLSSIWICLFVRLYVRIKLNGPWKWDDWCIAIATILSSARSAVIYLAVVLGLGESLEYLSPSSLLPIGRTIFAANILYILSLLASKYAIAALCLRLTAIREHTRIICTTIAAVTVTSLSSLLLIRISCSPSPWVSPQITQTCPGLSWRWIAICVMDITTEVALVAIPLSLVLSLQMSLKLKLMVFFAFGVRIPTIIFSSFHIVALLKEITSDDPTLLGAITQSWSQIQLDYGIITSTLTCLGAFLSPFNTRFIFTTATSANLDNIRRASIAPYSTSVSQTGTSQRSYRLKHISTATGVTGTTAVGTPRKGTQTTWSSLSLSGAGSHNKKDGSNTAISGGGISPGLGIGGMGLEGSGSGNGNIPLSPVLRMDTFPNASKTLVTAGRKGTGAGDSRRVSEEIDEVEEMGMQGIMMEVEWEITDGGRWSQSGASGRDGHELSGLPC